MKILLLGNSDTTGLELDRAEHPWPDLVRAARPQDTLAEVRFVPVGDAAAYVDRKVAELEPEFIVLPLSVYVCAVGLVRERVRRRFGSRAEAAYLGLERRFDGQTRRAGEPGRLNRLAQAVTRRVVGTEARASVDQVITAYNSVLLALARREGVHVVVMGDGHFGQEIRRQNRRVDDVIARVQASVRPVIDQHRFTWVDAHAAMQAAGDVESLMHPDGVHLSPAGHVVVAALVLAALPALEPVRPGSSP